MATLKQQFTLEQLIAAIRQLPLEQKRKLRRVFEEEAVEEIEYKTREERERQLSVAAEALLEDYTTDEELISFTALDSDDFHAAK